MRRHDFRHARCLVTGASSGIGRCLAEQLLREGARVVLTGRNVERLRQVVIGLEAEAAPGAAHVIPADLTDPGSRQRLVSETAAHFGGALDLVVNSAGVGAYGRFESHDPSVLRDLFEINVVALAEVCRGVHPLLRRGDRPAVVNLGSIVARRGLPGRAEYSASKFAVAGLTESLRAEWAIDGIHLLLANPGWTATAFENNVLVDTAFVKSASWRTAQPEAVARAILKALLRGRNEVTLSLQGRTLTWVNRLLPRLVDRGMGRWTRRLYSSHGLGTHLNGHPVEGSPSSAYNERLVKTMGD